MSVGSCHQLDSAHEEKGEGSEQSVPRPCAINRPEPEPANLLAASCTTETKEAPVQTRWNIDDVFISLLLWLGFISRRLSSIFVRKQRREREREKRVSLTDTQSIQAARPRRSLFLGVCIGVIPTWPTPPPDGVHHYSCQQYWAGFGWSSEATVFVCLPASQESERGEETMSDGTPSNLVYFKN